MLGSIFVETVGPAVALFVFVLVLVVEPLSFRAVFGGMSGKLSTGSP